jgi:hypothetical protein
LAYLSIRDIGAVSIRFGERRRRPDAIVSGARIAAAGGRAANRRRAGRDEPDTCDWRTYRA